MSNRSNREQAQIGIVGGGQLARMMCQSAISAGFRVRVLTANQDDSAAQVWHDTIVGNPDDPAALAELCRNVEVVTFDHELVSLDALRSAVSGDVAVRPSIEVLAVSQNKQLQRERFSAMGLPVPRFAIATSPGDLTVFGDAVGWPIVIKAVTGGYDGRGVWVANDLTQAEEIFGALVHGGVRVLVEEHVQIVSEFAQQIARRPNGEIRCYPLARTVQKSGILHEVQVPAFDHLSLTSRAQQIAITIAEELAVSGMLAVEYLWDGDHLIINEIATRPHNSGHYTIEGCVTSQFENHLRAVLDLPLGATDLIAANVVSVNILGGDHPPVASAYASAAADPRAHIHWYGKKYRPGRKLGHVTVTGNDPVVDLQRARSAATTMGGM